MRKIDVNKIREAVSRLCIEANTDLRADILSALKKAYKAERQKTAKRILGEIIENAGIARRDKTPICQDTGMAVVYLEIGQDVSLVGGDLYKAVNEGVRDGYRKGYLRKSVVQSPIDRKNTGANTPAVIHTDIVPGSRVRIAVSPKGFGSENKSRIRMFNPTVSVTDVMGFVSETVERCGADACPPLVVGVGMGGTFEKAAELSKAALLRPINKTNPDKALARMEQELLRRINSLGIGPMGLGGRTTALGVNILSFPTHIAGLPVAVCISCHATRSAETTI